MFISSYEKLRQFLRQRIAIETMPHVGPRAFKEVTGEKVNTTLLVFRREPDAQARNDSVGMYFRLLKEPDGEAKRWRFEQAVANHRSGQSDPIVFRYRQGDFDAIPGSPWVYSISESIRTLYKKGPHVQDCASICLGVSTIDLARFYRWVWEVKPTTKWWFISKGGFPTRWVGQDFFRTNWANGGREQKEEVIFRYPYLKGNYGIKIHDEDFFGKPGLTFLRKGKVRFSTKLLPARSVFDHNGPAVFAEAYNELSLLGLLNSRPARFLLALISPGIDFQKGDVERLPIPSQDSAMLVALSTSAIELARVDDQEDEKSLSFIATPAWETGINDVADRHCKLAEIEQEIDEEVYRLYGISDEDRAAIEAELAEPTANDTSDEENGDFGSDTEGAEAAEEAPLTRDELARQWISYAVGIVMGRFQPGIDGALGRGHYSEAIAVQLRAGADSDGILVLDQGHPDDLAIKVLQALQAMLGVDAAAEVVAEGTGRSGNPEEELSRYFERTFFKEHIQKYRKRPVYWLLQSPRKKYGIWLFHEKLTKDTLYRIRGEQYVAQKIRLLETNMTDLRRQRDAAQGREHRALEKRMAEMEDVLDDLHAFAERIDAILQRGYTPHIDDGVLINMAPLWELMPSWQAEPKKCWEALARGDYDWSHQAMDHWPERVRKKCQTNKSYAIAHGLA